jgi:hypothetical protein
LKVGGALDGAKLADTKHRAHDGSLEANGIGDKSPNVGVRLQDQWGALNGGGIGALATLSETLLDQLLRLSEKGDALARQAFAAGVVGEALTVGGLREHARESKFADAARSGEEQSVRNAAGAKSAAQSCDDAIVAEEFREAHGQRAPELN